MKKLIALLFALLTPLFLFPLSACGEKEENLSSYVIEATYDADGGTLTATADFTFYNDLGNEIACLKFHLWGNAYRKGAAYAPVSDAYTAKAYYAGASYGSMTVENVENCASWDIGGEDEDILCVNLLSPVYPDQTANVKISYTLTLAKVNHRTGITASAVNLGNFYPVLCNYSREGFEETPYYSCGDPFVSACANYEVTLTIPQEYTAATSGKEVKSVGTGEKKICSYTLENARDFAAVLSDRFDVVSRETDGVLINYYYYDDDSPQTKLNVAADSLSYFSDTFGSYAYPTLSVVQTGFCMGGMEYPALTMISDALEASGAIYTIAHENAHQWWYAMVGSDQVNSSWQDEGLAEYSSLMFFEKNPNYGLTRTAMVGAATKAYRAFYSVYNQLFGDADTSMERSLKDFISDYEYANVAYNKGLLLFETLRQTVGDDGFAAALKNYCKENRFLVASPESLYAAFLKYGDVEGIFDSYILGKIII